MKEGAGVCVCACVCEREGERERNSKKVSMTGTVIERKNSCEGGYQGDPVAAGME